jgi:hypothetical protein
MIVGQENLQRYQYAASGIAMPSSVPDAGNGCGLVAIREQIMALGGTFLRLCG